MGNETLAFTINRYMDGMVQNLNQYGGDIIKFVGDAMIVMWPHVDNKQADYKNKRVDTIRRAIQCSQDIQKAMNNLQIMPEVKLQVKIGIGYGDCGILYVGGVFGRSETLTVGDALCDALKSEGSALGGGQIIVAHDCFKLVKEYFNSTEIVNKETKEFFYLVDFKTQPHRVKKVSDTIKMSQQFSVESLQSIQTELEGNVARCVLPFLRIQQIKFASEIRSLTVMFVSLGVDLSSANTDEGKDRIQSIMTTVQQQVYRMRGAINKLVMDDKGSTLICVWGLPPIAHMEDAQKGIQAGLNMIRELRKIKGDEMYCNIGISSGECFAGVVGTSGSRKEFSVLGDIVNLAARIMGYTKAMNLKNAIFCDQNTRMMAANQFDFIYKGHYELRGKSISTPFFEPRDPYLHEKKQTQRKIIHPELLLGVHQNPMSLARDSEHEARHCPLGFVDVTQDLCDDIVEYFTEICENQSAPYVQILKGRICSGKTTLILELVKQLYKESNFQDYLRINNSKLPIFASRQTVESAFQFLNAWRPILQMLLIFHSKHKKVDKENFVASCIIKSKNTDKANLVFEIFGLKKDRISSQLRKNLNEDQIKPKPNDYWFCSVPEYTESQVSELINLLTIMVKIMIEEANSTEFWGTDEQSKQSHRQSNHRSQNNDSTSQNGGICTPFVFILDDAHKLCPSSWKLLEQIIHSSERLVIIVAIKSDESDNFQVWQNSKEAFKAAWTAIDKDESVFQRIVDVPTLDSEQLNELLLRNAPVYQQTFMQEVQDSTKIIDPQNTIKNADDSAHLQEVLAEKWQIQSPIKNIDPMISNIIQRKCEGRPFFCMGYFVNMLQSKFVTLLPNGDVKPSDKFLECLKINDWTPLTVPRLSAKLALFAQGQFLQKFQNPIGNITAAQTTKANIATAALVLLKSSVVLGRRFQIQALQNISPLNKFANHGKVFREMIQMLEQNELIEILDMSDQKEVLCSYSIMLMREAIYQSIRYKAVKRGLHQTIERFFQAHPSAVCVSAQVRTDSILRHMMLAQDVHQEEQLNYERRKALTILRIQAQLSRFPERAIYHEELFALSKKGKLKKQKPTQIVVLTRTDMRWYQNWSDVFKEKYIGLIQLPLIYRVMRDEASIPAFSIEVSMRYTSSNKEMGRDTLLFGCESELDRDRWIAAIDYLKIKAGFDAYKKQNALVNFLGRDEKEMNNSNSSDTDNEDIEGLLYDFGKKFKINDSRGNTQHMHIKRAVTMTQQICLDPFAALKMQKSLKAKQERPELVPLKASEMVKKLRMLYSIQILGFMNHLADVICHSQESVTTFMQSKHNADQEWILKFPMLTSVDFDKEIIHEIDRVHTKRSKSAASDRSDNKSFKSRSSRRRSKNRDKHLQNDDKTKRSSRFQKAQTTEAYLKVPSKQKRGTDTNKKDIQQSITNSQSKVTVIGNKIQKDNKSVTIAAMIQNLQSFNNRAPSDDDAETEDPVDVSLHDESSPDAEAREESKKKTSLSKRPPTFAAYNRLDTIQSHDDKEPSLKTPSLSMSMQVSNRISAGRRSETVSPNIQNLACAYEGSQTPSPINNENQNGNQVPVTGDQLFSSVMQNNAATANLNTTQASEEMKQMMTMMGRLASQVQEMNQNQSDQHKEIHMLRNQIAATGQGTSAAVNEVQSINLSNMAHSLVPHGGVANGPEWCQRNSQQQLSMSRVNTDMPLHPQISVSLSRTIDERELVASQLRQIDAQEKESDEAREETKDV